MSSKQKKILISVFLVAILIMAAVVGLVLYVENISSGNDIELIKASGGYETLKADLVADCKVSASYASSIANIFFEDMQIKKYEGIKKRAVKGNYTVLVDGFELDMLLRGNEIVVIYIGEVIVYRNNKNMTANANIKEYSYTQYASFVETFQKQTKLGSEVAQQVYVQLNKLYVTAFSSAKKDTVDGEQGFTGKCGAMTMFITVNGTSLDTVKIQTKELGSIMVWQANNKDYAKKTLKDSILMFGERVAMSNSLTYQTGKALGDGSEVIFPVALTNGDDSWVMIKTENGTYLEVSGEVKTGEKIKTQQFIFYIDKDNVITKLLMGGKALIG